MTSDESPIPHLAEGVPAPPGYEMLAKIGEGGMGVVYKARQTTLGRLVAIKTLNLDSLDPMGGGGVGDSEGAARERFFLEGAALAQMNHEGIVRVHDLVSDGEDNAFIIMEFVEGRSLAELVEAGESFTPGIAALAIADAAAALHHAHERGVVHRDIKPGNIMISAEDGRVKLMDFGVARVLTAARVTKTGMPVGTIHYMSPEQLLGDRNLDARSDVYSLAVVLYHLLAGRLPFDDTNPIALSDSIRFETPKGPREANPGIGPKLERALLKGLEKKREDRFATAEEFEKALREAVREMDAAPAAPAGIPRRPTPQPAQVFINLGAGIGSEERAITSARDTMPAPFAPETGDIFDEVSRDRPALDAAKDKPPEGNEPRPPASEPKIESVFQPVRQLSVPRIETAPFLFTETVDIIGEAELDPKLDPLKEFSEDGPDGGEEEETSSRDESSPFGLSVPSGEHPAPDFLGAGLDPGSAGTEPPRFEPAPGASPPSEEGAAPLFGGPRDAPEPSLAPPPPPPSPKPPPSSASFRPAQRPPAPSFPSSGNGLGLRGALLLLALMAAVAGGVAYWRSGALEATSGKRPASDADRLQEAEKAFARGEPSEAAAILATLSRPSPRSEKLREAVAAFEEAARLFEGGHPAEAWKALEFPRAEGWTEKGAAAKLREGIGTALSALARQAWENAQEAYAQDDYRRAREHYLRAEELSPGFQNAARMARGMELLESAVAAARDIRPLGAEERYEEVMELSARTLAKLEAFGDLSSFPKLAAEEAALRDYLNYARMLQFYKQGDGDGALQAYGRISDQFARKRGLGEMALKVRQARDLAERAALERSPKMARRLMELEPNEENGYHQLAARLLADIEAGKR